MEEGTAPTHYSLAAIVFTDIVGFSRMMSENEAEALPRTKAELARLREVCERHSGKVLKSTGDGLLMHFTSAVQAVACALEIQSPGPAVDSKIQLKHRIGIHLGDVSLDDGDAMGDGVNIAARLQTQADPGGICISKTVYDVVKNRIAIRATFLGPRELKNISGAVPIYKILIEAQSGGSLRPVRSQGRPAWALALAGCLLVALLILALVYGRHRGLPGGEAVAAPATSQVPSVPAAAATAPAPSSVYPGSEDGTVREARFTAPRGVAVDGSGNVYVADTGNSVIRKITPDGVVTTFAGSPLQVAFGDGIGSAARFASPVGVAVDGSGNVYVADAGPNNAIRKITPGGAVTTLAGGAHQPGSDRDGTGVAARFNDPYALTVDSMGNVYVAEGRDGWTIRKITPEGVVTTLAGNAGNRGFADGRGPAALFDGLSGIAVDGGGNIYVADSGGNGLIRKITQDGVVTTLAGSPGRRDMLDGMGSLAQFNSPSGLAIDLKGNLYVAEIQGTSIRKVTPSGEVTTFAGKRGIGVGGYRDGSGQVALFNRPRGLAVDDNGNVYVADSGNNVIRKISSNGAVTTLAGAGSAQP